MIGEIISLSISVTRDELNQILTENKDIFCLDIIRYVN